MINRLKFWFPNLYNLALSLYSIIVFLADWHIRVIDNCVEIIKLFFKPVFAPVEHLYKDNEPLQRYFWYLSFSFIIAFSLACWPLFVYLFICLELAAMILSAFFPDSSYLVRRGIVASLGLLWIVDAYFFLDPLLLIEDGLSLLTFNDSNCFFTYTYLILQDIINEIHFWLYYFANFYAPQLCLTAILIAPLIAFVYAFFFGFLLGYKIIGYVASCFIFFTLLASSYILFFFPALRHNFIFYVDSAPEGDSLFSVTNLHEIMEFELYEFLKISPTMSVQMDFGSFIDATFMSSSLEFSVDSVSAIFVFVVTLISFLVHLYSTEYMKNDPHTVRFFGLLSFFTFSMLILVLSSDMLILFIGWEGVGLSSFLLISFWYTRVPALKSALKAILMNKIGDLFLLFAIALICYYSDGDMSIYLAADNVINHRFDSTGTLYGLSLIDLTALLITLAAFVKSAQLFFHTWLPDAMEGPTPVSALLHAATMVTAGVYLVIRFSFIIEFSYVARIFMLLISVWTLIITSLIALFQYDIKKIIAYSTCGQLAMMFIACSLSAYDFALFHFFNHAFFKCLLFLLAGMIIHELKNEQDIRAMGDLSQKMPYTFVAFTIAMLSSLGLPFLSGAASKDLIIALVDSKIAEAFYAVFCLKLNSFFYALFFIKARFALVVLTSLYMLRLYYYVFFCFPNHRKNIFNRPGYTDPFVRAPVYTFVISVLVLFSLFSGKVFKNFFIFTECNYLDIHNDIFSINCNTLLIATNSSFSFITHFTLLAILASAGYAFFWMKKNGHISFFSLRYNYFFAYRESVMYDTYVLDCFDEYEVVEKEQFLAYFWRPISWPMNIFNFFNKRCYFDYVYNYYIVYSTLEYSSYLRASVERGFFTFLADQIIAFSKKLGSMSGYALPTGFLVNLLYAFCVFTSLWFLPFFLI
jgi:proton-translocating NADH-quinone oxidoreductase chain L